MPKSTAPWNKEVKAGPKRASIGYPRALLYYHCFPFWNGFFVHLGHPVKVSGQTTKAILRNGVEKAVGECCLPVKLFYGHTLELAADVDWLFMPRLVSLEPRTYICPKFMGLPAMIRASLGNGLPPVIDIDVDARRTANSQWRAAHRVGRLLGHSGLEVWRAYRHGRQVQQNYERLLQAGLDPEDAMATLFEADHPDRGTARGNSRGADTGTGCQEHSKAGYLGHVFLVGHPYNVHDSGFNLEVKTRLRRQGFRVVTMEQVNPARAAHEASRLQKDIFWSLGRRMVGSTMHLLKSAQIDGIIHLEAFGCGPDSMIGEVVERQARSQGVPYLALILDEHTGEAGFLTRVEAFGEMLSRRIKH